LAYRLPRLIDLNAASRLLRGRERLVLLGRCLELEKPWALERLREVLGDYAAATVCLEAEHVNMVGFKLAGVLARVDSIREVVVATTDGSMHCVQLHYMVEELEKIMPGRFRRRHFVALRRGELVEVPTEAVRLSRHLARLARLLGEARRGREGEPSSRPSQE
jgi:hypothetical protein